MMSNDYSLHDFESFSKRVFQTVRKELFVCIILRGGIGVGAIAPLPIPIISLRNARLRLNLSIYEKELNTFLVDNYYDLYQQNKNDPQAIDKLFEEAKSGLLNHLLTL